ncbi:Tn3 family transposase [Bradyrhizobium sp. Arg314]
MDEVTGDGSAELLDDGSIDITFAYHNGDEASLPVAEQPSGRATRNGRIDRTLFTLRWFEDPELRRLVTAELNKEKLKIRSHGRPAGKPTPIIAHPEEENCRASRWDCRVDVVSVQRGR